MIILLIIIFAALVIIGFFYMKGLLSWLIGIFSLLMLMLSMIALIYHDNNHWGMKQVTTTKTQQIYSAGDSSQPYGLLIKEEFGTKSGNYLLIYKGESTDSKVTANFVGNTKQLALTDKSSSTTMKNWISDILSKNTVETAKKSATVKTVSGSTEAQIVSKTTRWEWDSSLAKWLFGVGGEAGELVKERITAEIPSDTWLSLTTTQLASLQEKELSLTAAQKQQMAAAQSQIQQKLAAAQTDAERLAIEQQAAKMEVLQIKQLLGITA